MRNTDAIHEFYQQHGQEDPGQHEFNVYRREEFACGVVTLPPKRWEFFKISLVTRGEGFFSYGDHYVYIDRPVLTLLNPLVPYAWKPATQEQAGFFCIFTDDFVSRDMKKERLAQSLLFQSRGSHILYPSEGQLSLLTLMFESMLAEMKASYVNKYDVLRHYVQIVMHEALKMQPSDSLYGPHNASQRLTALFNDLLEQQFPIEAPTRVLQLKNANEFAAALGVHTNHLNRALKEATGRTTKDLISHRVMQEAKAMLMYNGWSIAEIAYSLGFEHATNFHLFFKKQSGQTPGQFREAIASLS